MADISLTVDGVKFTFAEGEVKKTTSNIDTNLDVMAMSGFGPSFAYGFDYEGVNKTITISGSLFATGTTRISGYSIDTAIEQKQWLESLANGYQNPITFTSNYETLSVHSNLSATAPYQASFTNTTVKVKSMSFDEQDGLTGEISFSITFEVCR